MIYMVIGKNSDDKQKVIDKLSQKIKQTKTVKIPENTQPDEITNLLDGVLSNIKSSTKDILFINIENPNIITDISSAFPSKDFVIIYVTNKETKDDNTYKTLEQKIANCTQRDAFDDNVLTICITQGDNDTKIDEIIEGIIEYEKAIRVLSYLIETGIKNKRINGVYDEDNNSYVEIKNDENDMPEQFPLQRLSHIMWQDDCNLSELIRNTIHYFYDVIENDDTNIFSK